MVKISVIIPIYNTEEYLEECLDSIINQTLKDIEIICINDGSTDNSLSILENYAKKDQRIKVISQENKGQSATRNYGVSLANGKYIYFMDSDDILKTNALKDCFEICEEKKLDFLMFKLINYDEETGEYYEEKYYNMSNLAKKVKNNVFNYEDIDELIFEISVTPVNKLYNKSFLTKNEIKFQENIDFEDNIFIYPLLFSAKRIYFYDEHLYIRRRRQNSITSKKGIHYVDTIKVHNLICNEIFRFNLYNEYKNRIYNNKINLIYYRFLEIDDEFKDLYFNEMKNDFKKIIKHEKYNEFLDELEERNLKIFKTIINNKDWEKCISIIEEYDFKTVIFRYKIGRIDIKNFGDENNSVTIIDNSDIFANIKFPDWFKNEKGKGATIESKEGEIDLKIKCINNGTLKITLRGLDVKDKNNTRFPIYIDYTSLKINDEEQLEENILVWHDEPYTIKKEVKHDENITIHAEWKPFTAESTYNNKLKKQNKQLQKIKKENKQLQKQLQKAKKENKQLKNTKSWKITKPLRKITKILK